MHVQQNIKKKKILQMYVVQFRWLLAIGHEIHLLPASKQSTNLFYIYMKLYL